MRASIATARESFHPFVAFFGLPFRVLAVPLFVLLVALPGCVTTNPKPAIRPLAGVHGWPLDSADIKHLSPFGEARGNKRQHKGVDLGVRKGTAVLAAADGRVTFAGRVGEYGRCIIVRHPGVTQTLYAHLRKIVVREGKVVRTGQVIGYSGASGNATAPHLHYEVHKNGQPVDPESNRP